MAEPFGTEVTGVTKSKQLGASLERGYIFAREQSHPVVSLEHVLFALTDDPEAAVVLEASGVDLNRLRSDVASYIGTLYDDGRNGRSNNPPPDAELLRILKAAADAAQQSRRRQIDGAIVIAALVGDGKSPAAGTLRAHGLTFETAIRALQQVNAAAQARDQSAGNSAPARYAPSPAVGVGPSSTAPSSLLAPPGAPIGGSGTTVNTAMGEAGPSPVAKDVANPTDELLASVRARLKKAADHSAPSLSTRSAATEAARPEAKPENNSEAGRPPTPEPSPRDVVAAPPPLQPAPALSAPSEVATAAAHDAPASAADTAANQGRRPHQPPPVPQQPARGLHPGWSPSMAGNRAGEVAPPADRPPAADGAFPGIAHTPPSPQGHAQLSGPMPQLRPGPLGATDPGYRPLPRTSPTGGNSPINGDGRNQPRPGQPTMGQPLEPAPYGGYSSDAMDPRHLGGAGPPARPSYPMGETARLGPAHGAPPHAFNGHGPHQGLGQVPGAPGAPPLTRPGSVTPIGPVGSPLPQRAVGGLRAGAIDLAKAAAAMPRRIAQSRARAFEIRIPRSVFGDGPPRAVSLRIEASNRRAALTPRAPETQWLRPGDAGGEDQPIVWRWDLAGLQRGRVKVRITSQLHTLMPDGTAMETQIGEDVREIRVSGNAARAFRGLLFMLFAAAVGAAAMWFWIDRIGPNLPEIMKLLGI